MHWTTCGRFSRPLSVSQNERACCLHARNMAITSYSLRNYAPCIKQIFPASRKNGMCASSTTRTRSQSLPMNSCARGMDCFYRLSRMETSSPSDRPSHGNRLSDQPLAVLSKMSFDFRHCHFRTGKRRRAATVRERNVRKRPSYGRPRTIGWRAVVGPGCVGTRWIKCGA